MITLNRLVLSTLSGLAVLVSTATAQIPRAPLSPIYVDNQAQYAYSTMPDPGTWNASSLSTWLTFPFGSYLPQAGTFTIAVNANYTNSPRTGTLHFDQNGLPKYYQSVHQRRMQKAFTDLDPSAVYFDTAHIMYSLGLTAGCYSSPLSYCPESPTTRGQIATFIIRAIYGETFSYPQTPYFDDVPANHSWFKYIQKMRELGITSGCTTTTFCPDQEISNKEMVTFAMRGWQVKYQGSVNNSISCPNDFPCTPYFSDVSSGNYFFVWVQLAAYRGVIYNSSATPGCAVGSFCPDITGSVPAVDRGWVSRYVVRGVLADFSN